MNVRWEKVSTSSIHPKRLCITKVCIPAVTQLTLAANM